MKNIKFLLYLALGILLFAACDDANDNPIVIPGDVPVISEPTSGSAIILERQGAGEKTVSFAWSKADFNFQSATTYTLQADAAGNNFTNKVTLASTANTYADLTHQQLNQRLLTIGLATNQPVGVEFRVAATVNVNVDTLYSEPLQLDVSLYASTFPPIYMIGAPIGGWDPGKAVQLVSTGEPYVYTTIVEFDIANGQNFRFFEAPDWGASLGGYDVFTTYPENLLEPAAGDDDPNFNFIGEPGWYRMTVNSSVGTIEMSPVSKPVMYLTGDATHGWSWDDPVTEIFWTGYMVWEGEVDFVQGNAFRLFRQKDWGPDSYGWDYIENYDTNYIDVFEGHGDPNWQFLAPTGTYYVIVNLLDLSIEISEI